VVSYLNRLFGVIHGTSIYQDGHEGRRLYNLPDRYGAVGHAKVNSDGLLASNTSKGLSLRSSQAGEDANLQHAGDLLNRPRQGIDLPNSSLSAPIFASGNVSLGEQWSERSVDDVEVLVRLQGSLGGAAEPNRGLNAAQLSQLG
jgi:hypothetical protein